LRQREPEELASAHCRAHAPPIELAREVRAARRVPREGALVVHLDAGDPRAHDRGREASANDLDLGKLRHRPRQRPRATASAPPPSRPASCSCPCPTPCAPPP